jgi:hypothetical protein
MTVRSLVGCGLKRFQDSCEQDKHFFFLSKAGFLHSSLHTGEVGETGFKPFPSLPIKMIVFTEGTLQFEYFSQSPDFPHT